MDEDDVLVVRLAAGDDEAVGELFDRYAPFVLGFARRITGDAEVAEDIVQDVFTALWSAPDRFDPARGSLRAYLGALTYGRAIDAVRSDSRRRAREERVGISDLSRGTTHGCDPISAATLAEVVRDAINRLPVEQRAAVQLVYWHGLTGREVARVLGIPEGTAKSRLRVAQSKLSEWLAPLNGEPV